MCAEVRCSRSSVRRTHHQVDVLWFVQRVRQVLFTGFRNRDLNEFQAMAFDQSGPAVQSFADQFGSGSQPIEIYMITVFGVVDTICLC